MLLKSMGPPADAELPVHPRVRRIDDRPVGAESQRAAVISPAAAYDTRWKWRYAKNRHNQCQMVSVCPLTFDSPLSHEHKKER
ncbi:hypothetical protein EYF80_000143 [Liparis tanakae]|uniref:Uncharacterized protein n=1 Tax=Liparis tanakae TaxID=230148 RepID=A0A4Z2JH92_9TELE|nr:hypothetical protein EYF80_000143 [Liparis tanakae]